MSEFTDTVVTAGKDSAERTAPRGPVKEESIREGETDSYADSNDTFDDAFSDGELPAHVIARLDAIDAKRAPAAAAGDAPTEEAPVVPAQPEAPVAAADPPKQTTLEADVAELDRLRAANAQLVADLEAQRAAPRPPAATSGFVGKVDYLDDSVTRLREFIAHELGVAADHADVDAELAYLHADLTAKELGLTTDAALSAKRDAARAKQLFAREKRQRATEGATDANKATASAETKQADEAAQFIGAKLKRDEFPLLIDLAEDVDGKKPEALLWQVIQRETQTGRFAKGMTDDALIGAAAKLIEDRYQALIAKATKAKTIPSTATPPSGNPPAAAPNESKATRQSPGARTITAADASVAPATPPAPKPKTDDKKPKFKTAQERMNYALRHLDKR